MMNKQPLGALFLVAAAAAPALADNPDGPYVGGGYGRFDLHIHNFRDVGQSAGTIVDSNDNAWKLFAGWRLNPHLAFEGAYLNLGHPGEKFVATGSNGKYDVKITGFSPAIIGTLPFGPVEIFAKAGYYFYDVKLKVNAQSLGSAGVESSHSRSDFLYGAGAGVTFMDHLHLRGEYERIDISNYKNSDALWLTAAWRF
jgi:opacity protein-like surface antigen